VQLNATTMLSDRERLAARGTRTGAFVTEEAAASEPAEMGVSAFENSTAQKASAEAPDFMALTAMALIGLAAVALRKKR